MLQCSVNKIGGEQLLSTAESSIDLSHGKLQTNRGDHMSLRLPFHNPPVAQRIVSIQYNLVSVEMKNKRHNDFQLILVFNMHKS